MERFATRFAPLLGGQDACAAHYASLQVPPDAIVIDGEALGQGHFGAVARGHLHVSDRKGKTDTLRAHTSRNALLPASETETCLSSGRPVAVKTVLDTDAASLEQLLLEARLLAAMNSPHVVRLLAVQETQLPLLLAMELCTLGDLREYLRKGAAVALPCGLPAAQLDMARQTAAGVAYLHSRQCVHRDLAARNVLVTEATARGGGGPSCCGVLLKLADLGLARVVQDQSDYYRVSKEGGG